VVLLGLPGAGKGTQAVRLSYTLGVPHIATGDLIRAAIRAGGSGASRIAERVARGELVPDSVTLGLLLERLSSPDADAGCVLDGYPRTRAQAMTLDDELEGRGRSIGHAVLLDVPIAIIGRRLSGRRICATTGHPYHVDEKPPQRPDRCDIDGSTLIQRPDDHPEVVENRLILQRDGLLDVVDVYRSRGLLRTVAGDAPEATVASAVLRAIGATSTVTASASLTP
jgi:adenylate kinase